MLVCDGIYQYVLVYTGSYSYVLVHTSMYYTYFLHIYPAGYKLDHTRMSILVHSHTALYPLVLFWIRGGTRNVKIVHTSTYRYVRTHDISMAVHTGMYWYVLYCTRRYKEVQPSTKRYTVVQGTVQGGTRQYVLVCTGMY